LVKKTFYVQDDVTQPSSCNQPGKTLQGRPGKSGAKGEKGDIGQTGSKGETGSQGTCSCAVSDERFNEMSTMIQTLQQQIDILNQYNPRLACEHKGHLYHAGVCYFLSDTKTRLFAEAKLACGSMQEGSELASIKSTELYKALQIFIRTQIKGSGRYNIWTSGTYDFNSQVGGNQVCWMDGSCSTISWKWYPGYPTTTTGYTHFYILLYHDPTVTNQGVANIYDNWTPCYHLCSYR